MNNHCFQVYATIEDGGMLSEKVKMGHNCGR